MRQFQESASGIAGELIDLRQPPGQMMRFFLRPIPLHRYGYAGGGYAEWENRLADTEAAFEVLHFLHHLRELAFAYVLSDIYHLNAAILRALTQYHQRTRGRPYQLHVHKCFFGKDFNVLDYLLPTPGKRRARTKGVDTGSVMFLRVYTIVADVAEFGGMPRVLELAITVGDWCRKLRCSFKPSTDEAAVVQQVDEAMQVGPHDCQCAGVLTSCTSFQFVNIYRLRPGDCPVQRVRIPIFKPLDMRVFSHLIPFDPAQLAERYRPNSGKFEHIDSASGRRYRVGVEWDVADNGTRTYCLRSLSFSLP